jgi:hypothetical protein
MIEAALNRGFHTTSPERQRRVEGTRRWRSGLVSLGKGEFRAQSGIPWMLVGGQHLGQL